MFIFVRYDWGSGGQNPLSGNVSQGVFLGISKYYACSGGYLICILEGNFDISILEGIFLYWNEERCI